MKTLHYSRYFNLILMAGLMLVLTSCEAEYFGSRDSDIGYTITGHWFGDLDMRINGERARGSEIEFIPRSAGYYYGTGYEIDYYRRGSVRHNFNWEVQRGVLYLTFDDPALDCAIIDYHLDDSYFSGYIADPVTLENISSFNLRYYDTFWDAYGYGNYYYVKPFSRSGSDSPTASTEGEVETDSTMSAPVCIRGVNMKDE